ncbi:hypothetical protein, partial [Legionella sainthelensi]
MRDESKTALINKIKIIIGKTKWSHENGIQVESDFYDLAQILRELKKQKDKKLDFLHQLDIFTIIYIQLLPLTKEIPQNTPPGSVDNI